MKNQNLIPGIILIGFGIYYYLLQINLVLFDQFFTWPTLMAIVGIAFLVQGYRGKDYDSILPGVILFGFGCHLHIVGRLDIWPDHLGAFILIIALAFLLRYQKTGTGLFHGILFLILAALLLFYDQITIWLGTIESGLATVWKFWPIALVLIGIYLLFFNKGRR
ncbi:MAG: LiaI-LiaF-like domain-containing protein [Bacillota bacterium]